MTNSLFEPLRLGDLVLPNRIVMAPLTRNRAMHGTDAANGMMAQYYAQRASAGLIISEASQITQQGQGYIWTPGIYTKEQIVGWRKVTDAVHAAGGRIFMQMWHVGRISHVSLQPGGKAPVSSSAEKAMSKTFIESGFVPVSMPRALDIEEIPGIVRDYRNAAQNAKDAGFDGVEIHAANGYLLDQFMKNGVNKRTDSYGGSIENRTRLTLEVAEAILRIWDKSCVGIRLSPAHVNDAKDNNPQALFNHVAEKLGALGLGYLHVIEGTTGGDRNSLPFDYQALRSAFKGVFMLNNGYTRATAEDAITSGKADLISFGRPFISNPDLVERLRRDAPLNPLDPTTLYGGTEKGYTDYPTMA